jgi:hypothetical protein
MRWTALSAREVRTALEAEKTVAKARTELAASGGGVLRCGRVLVRMGWDPSADYSGLIEQLREH